MLIKLEGQDGITYLESNTLAFYEDGIIKCISVDGDIEEINPEMAQHVSIFDHGVLLDKFHIVQNKFVKE